MASLTNGHKFEQALEDGEGQGSLACFSPWGHESYTTERLNTTTMTDMNCNVESCNTQHAHSAQSHTGPWCQLRGVRLGSWKEAEPGGSCLGPGGLRV